MADRMEFPKTMKEFIDNFSFKDTEEVYTNGAELIPVFRVEQALEHYEKEIRAKAIDEFAERLRMNTSEYEVMDGFGAIEEIVDAVDIDTIFEIAEQMKAGAENE